MNNPAGTDSQRNPALSLGDITLAVLAGGQGSRMGQPKGLLQVRGQPILHHLLRRWNWPGPTLLVTAPGREHPPAWEEFDREVSDPIAGEGPLRGILTALDTAQTELVIITTVDMPGIGRPQLKWLLEQAINQPNSPGAVFKRMAAEGEVLEPFPAVLQRTLRHKTRASLERQEGGVQRFLGICGVVTLRAAADWPASLWVNLNYPADIEAYMKEEMAL